MKIIKTQRTQRLLCLSVVKYFECSVTEKA